MKSIFFQRSGEKEIMDDLRCTGEVVDQTLRELEFINRTLGGNKITLDGVKQLAREEKNESLEIIDLGCGGGDMLKLLAKKFQQNNFRFIGMDANPNIVAYAKSNCSEFKNIDFEAIDILSEEFKSKKFDIAIATLFFHHFPSNQLSAMIKNIYSQSRVGIIINDLQRHPLAYYSIKILTRLFSKSAMVKFDAPLSVLRGFSRKEMESILAEAGIKNYTLHWRWAFRWQVIIPKNHSK